MDCATSNKESSPATESCQKGSPAGSKTPDTPSRCRSPGSPVGDDACSICLGAFTDKCAAGSCLHNFCLVCLKEWAKQRPVCPLCKQPFTKILYDIKSETDYKEWNIPVQCSHDIGGISNFQIIQERIYQTFGEYLDRTNRRFFRYRSTRTNASRNLENEILNDVMDTYPRLPSLPARRDHRPVAERGSSAFRLSIYTNNVWIQPMADLTGRYRESNPNLYREQPALTHRLVPWVNRELAALVPPSRISVVLTDIMELIERYTINGRSFRRALRPYLGNRTRHFVHEFYNFARSPYDMIGHDQAAQYIPRDYMSENETDDTDGSDDDDVVEIDSDGAVVETEPLDLSSRVAREETIGNDGSIFISSDSDSSMQNSSTTNIREDSQNSNHEFFVIRDSPSDNSPIEERNATRSLDEPGPSGIIRSGYLHVKSELDENTVNSDTDDCLIVDVLKPKKERTPELIDISSGSESESANQTHWKKKMSKQLEDNSEGHKKPRLDRTSFSLQFTGTLNCQRGEDHNYCTESASSLNPGSNRTESEDDNFRVHRSLYNTKKRWDRLESGSDSEWNGTHSDLTDEYKPEKRKTKNYKSSIKRARNGNSRKQSLSPATRKGKKDHKSKIKSSSKVKSKPSTSEENSVSDSLRKRNSTYGSKRSINGYSKRLRICRGRSSSTSSSKSLFSSTSSASRSSSSSSSCSSSSSSSSSYNSSSSSSSSSSYLNTTPSFVYSSESDRSYYSSSHRKRADRRPSKDKEESKKRKRSTSKNKASTKSSKEKGKAVSKNRSKSKKQFKVEKKSSKKFAKEVEKRRYK